MLKSLRIRNYQSHRDTTLSFVPGITGIIGKSLSGKTTCLRALRWVARNKPAGFSFHSHFAETKDTIVDITTSDDTVVTRAGGNKKYYNMTGLKKPLQGFGRQVPDIIEQKLNLKEVNIQEQWDVPFLITSPPGQVAETINKATNVEKINDWVREINRESNRLKSKAEVIRNDIDELEDKIESLQAVDKIEDKILRLKKLDRKINKLTIEQSELIAIKEGLAMARAEIKRLKKVDKIKKKIKKLQSLEKKFNLLKFEAILIEKVRIKKAEIKEAVILHEDYEKQYMRQIKKESKCPTCYGSITDKALRRVKNAIRVTI